MIKHQVQENLKNAEQYFREHLCAGDYYNEKKAVKGDWQGEGAKRLGLSGHVSEKQFLELCKGNNPETGEFLTQHNLSQLKKNGEAKKSSSKRRIFYDFTISCPKTVALVACLENEKVKRLHDESVKVAMAKLESYAEARVRKGGANYDRKTGNIICGTFRHETSRALDPHLHSHCLVFNATYDEVERKWKAIQAKDMIKAEELANKVYFNELISGLRKMGYEVDFKNKQFEIRGIPEEIKDRFSKRRQEIYGQLKQFIKDGGIVGNEEKIKEQIQIDTRGKKKNVAQEELIELWAKQLTGEEKKIFEKITQERLARAQEKVTEKICDTKKHVGYALEKIFERESAIDERKIIEEALWHACGNGEKVSEEEISKEVKDRVIRSTKNEEIVTTAEAIVRESDIIVMVQSGLNKYDELKKDRVKNPELTEEQEKVVNRILKSKDFVTIFRGKAGTGKSYTLGELKKELGQFKIFAPQGKQVEALKEDGFKNAKVLASIENPYVNFENGEIIAIDEAGQVSGRMMQLLLKKAQEKNCRIILCGDTKQHGAVEATDAMELIERFTTTTRAELAKIRRQDPERAKTLEEKRYIERYREAVNLASKGDVIKSFTLLEKMGSVLESETKTKDFLEEYNKYIEETPLVVTQTRESRSELNGLIRELRRKNGLIENEDRTFNTYSVRNFTLAEKKNHTSYNFETKLNGEKVYKDALIFVRAYGNTSKNSICEIVDVQKDKIVYRREDKTISEINFAYANYFQVGEKYETELAIGEKIVTKTNGISEDFKKICNGEIVEVTGVSEKGNLLVKSEKYGEKELSKDRLVLDYGYSTTSYNSQGMTAERVYLYDTGFTGAGNLKQWYVSISRGRKEVKVFTSSKATLKENIELLGERTSAVKSLGLKRNQVTQQQWFESFGRTEQEKRLIQEALKLSHGELTEKSQNVVEKPRNDNELQKNFEILVKNELFYAKSGAELIEEEYRKEYSRYQKERQIYEEEVSKATNKVKYFFKIEEKPKEPKVIEKRFSRDEINTIREELRIETDPLKKEIKETMLKYAEYAIAKKYSQDLYEGKIKDIIWLNKIDADKHALEIADRYKNKGIREEDKLTRYWYEVGKKQQNEILENGTIEEKEEAKNKLDLCTKGLIAMKEEAISRKREAKELKKEESYSYSIGMW